MFDILVNNLPTLVVVAAVVALITFVAVKMIRDKRKGKGTCGCNCANCPNANIKR